MRVWSCADVDSYTQRMYQEILGVATDRENLSRTFYFQTDTGIRFLRLQSFMFQVIL